MHIGQSTLRTALLRSYRDAADHDSTMVDEHALRVSWANTGLRHSDFAVALRDMKQHHYLLVREHGDRRLIELTLDGQRELRRPSGSAVQKLADWLRLKRVALRRLRHNLRQLHTRARGRRDKDKIHRLH